MTLPALVSKMSGMIPRFVTIEGRVITAAGVTPTADGSHHHGHWGHVTAVRPHTNHGGAAQTDADVRPWWGLDGALIDEEVNMAACFPSFVRTVVEGRPAWAGLINTGRGTFGITVVHRTDHGLPRVVPDRPALFRRPEGRRFRRSPHLFDNGDLCVAREADWHAEDHDATVVIAWAAHWLATFTTWRITGRGWPCEGVGHDSSPA